MINPAAAAHAAAFSSFQALSSSQTISTNDNTAMNVPPGKRKAAGGIFLRRLKMGNARQVAA